MHLKNKIIQKLKQVLSMLLIVVLFLSFSFNTFADNSNLNYETFDLFKDNNLNWTLKKSLEIIVKDDYKSRFITEKFDSVEKAKPEFKSFVVNLIEYLNNNQDSIENSQIYILKSLKKIENCFYNKDDLFAKYILGMKKAYQVSIAKRLTNIISNENRILGEKELERTTQSSQIKIGVKEEICHCLKIDESLVLDTNSSMTDTSFYTINIGGSVKLNIEVGISKLFNVSVGIDYNITDTAIFYCLEQLLDSNKLEILKLTSVAVNRIVNSRNEMQRLEKDLLSIFSYVEGFLKSLEIINTTTNVEYPSVTKTIQAETAVSSNITGNASINSFSTLSATGKLTATEKFYKKPVELISLINDDCSIHEGLTLDDVKKILGEEYEILDKDFYSNSLKLNYAVSYVLGEIRFYNSILSQLSVDPSNKDLRNSKHCFEDRWLKKSKFKSYGRIDILKTMIIAAIELKAKDQIYNFCDLNKFKFLYSEIVKLSKLQEFSKNKESRSATFFLSALARNYAAEGEVKLEVPYLGEVKFNVIRTRLKDNPFQQENGDYTQVKLTIPTSTFGIIGLKAIRSELGKKMSFNNSDLLLLTSEALNLMIENLLFPDFATDSNSTIFSVMMVRTSPENDMLKVMLPGSEEISLKSKNEWTLQYFQVMSLLGAGSKTNPKIWNLGLSSELGFRERYIGSNTLTYISARYNAYQLGLKASKSKKNTAWDLFEVVHKKELEKLFLNLNNTNSNVYYELQIMYNIINSKLKIETERQNCKVIFKNFLDSCKKMNEYKYTDNVRYNDYCLEAFSNFNKMMKINHQYNFMIFYNHSYSCLY